ncbi:DUF1120 domain-containing protein [Enterobacter asburiae]|uniref:DUF1120 domain-containing protein n=1 Tax=Scandinavium sp. UTDF21-P1B TaxID=3446379 RepID=UPI003491DCE3
MKAVMRKTLLAAVLAATAGQALAAGESIDVKVIGQIVPAACTANVTGGATVDYGTMKTSTLATDDFTMLDVKTLELSIACEAPVKLALKTQDMRSDSVVDIKGKQWGVKATSVPTDRSQVASLGLGLSNGKKIGAWGIWMEPDTIKADGNAVDGISLNSKPTENTKWSKSQFIATWLAKNGVYRSWAATGTVTPVALTTLTGTLSVQAGINKASELDLTRPVTLDGLATLQVYYL